MLLSYNYVTAAKRSDGTQVVLKIGVANSEFISEMTALRYYSGDGCAILLEADPENYMFLLERLFPGEMLVKLEDDDIRTHIACDVMSYLWRPVPVEPSLIRLRNWFGELEKVRIKFDGKTGPFPEKIFEQVEWLLPELFTNSQTDVFLHGDFHHYNVLSSDRGWLAIDPKGVIGPAEYECSPLLINPMSDYLPSIEVERRLRRRIAILEERLGFQREVIRSWAICHSILSAWWDLDENGRGGEKSLAFSEVVARMKL